MSVETDKLTAQETKLSAEELSRIPGELFDLSFATLKSLPGFPKKYKKPGVVNFPHGGLSYRAECKEVEGRWQFSLIEFSRDINGVNTHIQISSGLSGSIGYLKIPLFGSGEKLASFRKRSVSFKDSFEAEREIRDFFAKF